VRGDAALCLRHAGGLARRHAAALPLLWRAFAEPAREAGPAMGSVVEVDGIRMRIDPLMSPANIRKLARGRHTSHERALLGAALRDGDRVLELGGGIGMVSAACALRLGSGAVTTYEANPALEGLIRDNHALNGVAPEVRMAMVGERAGTRPLHVARMFSHSSVHDVGETVHVVDVPVHEFAAVLAERRPSVLVVDIQGAEGEPFLWRALDGVRLVLVEMHPQVLGLSGMLALRRRLRALGFAEGPRAGNAFLHERAA
jgi:FkbM family methyltransferase